MKAETSRHSMPLWMIYVDVIWQTSRPQFLVLAVIVCSLTMAWLSWAGHKFSIGLAFGVMVAAILAHALVNWLNEIHDAHTGLDAITQRSPFNGGSGALQTHPDSIRFVTKMAISVLFVLLGFGVWLTWLWNGWMIPMGILGLAVILTYSAWMTRMPWIGWSSPGLGLGLIMMLGVAFALTGHYPIALVSLALLPFLLINNLLLLNQFPDKTADQQVGRRTLPIAIGSAKALTVYKLNLGLAMLWLVGLVILQQLPLISLIALLGFLPMGFVWSQLKPGFELTQSSNSVLAMNVIHVLSVISLVALSLVISLAMA